jgi:hypothetical protein
MLIKVVIKDASPAMPFSHLTPTRSKQTLTSHPEPHLPGRWAAEPRFGLHRGFAETPTILHRPSGCANLKHAADRRHSDVDLVQFCSVGLLRPPSHFPLLRSRDPGPVCRLGQCHHVAPFRSCSPVQDKPANTEPSTAPCSPSNKILEREHSF